MSDRASQLLGTADKQITELSALLSRADETVLRSACPGREKLGGGTVGAVALHTADTYQRIAASAQAHSASRSERHHGNEPPHHGPGHGHPSNNVDLRELLERLAAGREALRTVAHLTEEHLDAVPPAGQARFSDGQRTLEDVLTRMLNHQARQIDALRAAIA